VPVLAPASARLPGLITDIKLVVIEGAPHAIAWTHADQVNKALLDFLADQPPIPAGSTSRSRSVSGTAGTRACSGTRCGAGADRGAGLV
jgi:hypothetical protein